VCSEPDRQCHRRLRLTVHKRERFSGTSPERKQLNCKRESIMIIVRLLSPEPVGWYQHHQLYSGVGADIVMESISLIDPLRTSPSCQLSRAYSWQSWASNSSWRLQYADLVWAQRRALCANSTARTTTQTTFGWLQRQGDVRTSTA
jgi:hypothetical protein